MDGRRISSRDSARESSSRQGSTRHLGRCDLPAITHPGSAGPGEAASHRRSDAGCSRRRPDVRRSRRSLARRASEGRSAPGSREKAPRTSPDLPRSDRDAAPRQREPAAAEPGERADGRGTEGLAGAESGSEPGSARRPRVRASKGRAPRRPDTVCRSARASGPAAGREPRAGALGVTVDFDLGPVLGQQQSARGRRAIGIGPRAYVLMNRTKWTVRALWAGAHSSERGSVEGRCAGEWPAPIGAVRLGDCQSWRRLISDNVHAFGAHVLERRPSII